MTGLLSGCLVCQVRLKLAPRTLSYDLIFAFRSGLYILVQAPNCSVSICQRHSAFCVSLLERTSSEVFSVCTFLAGLGVTLLIA